MSTDARRSSSRRGSVTATDLYDVDCERKVLIIVTGGTFIMAPTAQGLEVQPGYLVNE